MMIRFDIAFHSVPSLLMRKSRFFLIRGDDKHEKSANLKYTFVHRQCVMLCFFMTTDSMDDVICSEHAGVWREEEMISWHVQ